MTNRLIHENSPYLLQHAENPVNWYPWGVEALEKAKGEDKPIFLSVGYAACHWCHVMAHESFEDSETAAIMNEYFVNIKVDREERPDLDDIYMNAVVAMTGRGGWPMSVFLTPEGQPFFGGTYFPPVRRYNMASFPEILQTVATLWQQDRERLLRSGEQITQHLLKTQSIATIKPLSKKALDEAALRLAQTYDWKHGGWGHAPKFPQPMAIEFLLQRAADGDKMALDIATHALNAMARGGMYDIVGGGFARYSTDNNWVIPHFEKMLYDNAQLARVYLHAYLLTGDGNYRRVSEETLDFIVREMMISSNNLSDLHAGIFSSLDADSEGEEGKFYTWTSDELCTVLKEAQKAENNSSRSKLDKLDWCEFFLEAYGVTEEGNFDGRVILQRKLSDKELSSRFGMPVERVGELLSHLQKYLLSAREQRARPALDDKVLASWNALALIAFAEAARYLNRNDYLDIARSNADFILTKLHPRDRLLRTWRMGRAQYNAYLEDYAGSILGLLALYQSDPDLRWFNSATKLAGDMIASYSDPLGGFFDTREDHDRLLMRPKNIQDNATPSGNALAAMALLQLAAYTGRGEWRDIAEAQLGTVLELVTKHPIAFTQWLCALDFALADVQEVAIIGRPDHLQTSALINILWKTYRPHLVAAISPYPPESDAPMLLRDRPLLEDQPTAYVCRKFVCQKPVISSNELASQLQPTRL